MQMLVFSSLDLITEHYAKIKGDQEHKANKELAAINGQSANTSCYIGLLHEANIGEYELDVYAYVSNTKYKYIVIKSE